jgi:hypothetical protein
VTWISLCTSVVAITLNVARRSRQPLLLSTKCRSRSHARPRNHAHMRYVASRAASRPLPPSCRTYRSRSPIQTSADPLRSRPHGTATSPSSSPRSGRTSSSSHWTTSNWRTRARRSGGSRKNRWARGRQGLRDRGRVGGEYAGRAVAWGRDCGCGYGCGCGCGYGCGCGRGRGRGRGCGRGRGFV